MSEISKSKEFQYVKIPIHMILEYVGISNILEVLIIVMYQKFRYVRNCDTLEFNTYEIPVHQKFQYVGVDFSYCWLNLEE